MDEIEEDAMNQHDYRWPACRSSQDLAIRAHIWTALVADGSDPDGRTPDHDHYWDEAYDAACIRCGWTGKVLDLGGDS